MCLGDHLSIGISICIQGLGDGPNCKGAIDHLTNEQTLVCWVSDSFTLHIKSLFSSSRSSCVKRDVLKTVYLYRDE